jgi:hypothetical protein
VLVKQEFGVDGQEESSSSEVQAVVSLVLEHARKSPELSLGVITMGIRHMTRVQAALDHALQEHPEIGTFFDPSRSERFFVKNLERVQGDERDAIIISIGYGKDRAGNPPHHFGPLLPEGGRRRLNVAVTRARQKLTVVSSFSHLDVDLTRVRPGSGVELLRNYLQYAASNGRELGDADVTGKPLNAFESEVFDCLEAAGLKLIHLNDTADPIENHLAALRLLEGVAGDVDVVIPGHGSIGGADQVHARIDQDRAYVHALRDAHVTSDPRVGPVATYDWLPGVHARQLQRLAQRSERNGTPG